MEKLTKQEEKRLERLERRVERLERDIKKYNEKLPAHIDSHIIKDAIKREKDPSTTHCYPFRHTKYIYKYSIEEIAKKWDVTEDYVLELLDRKNIKRDE